MRSSANAARLPSVFNEPLRGLSEIAGRMGRRGGGEDATQHLHRYGGLVEQIGDLATEMGLIGLHDVAVLFGRALEAIGAPSEVPSSAILGALKAWPELVGIYLHRPDMRRARSALIAHLRRPYFNLALTEAQVERLEGSLRDWWEPITAPASETVPASVAVIDSGDELLSILNDPMTDPFSIFDHTGLLWEGSAVGSGATVGGTGGAAEDIFNSDANEEPAEHTWDIFRGEAAPSDAEPLFDARELSDLGAQDLEPVGSAAPASGAAAPAPRATEIVAAAQPGPVDAQPGPAAPSAPAAQPSQLGPAAAGPPMGLQAVIPAAAREILDVIVAELPELEQALGALEDACTDAVDVPTREVCNDDPLSSTLGIVERIGAAAASTGLAGIGVLCDWAVPNLKACATSERPLARERAQAWMVWPALLRDYLCAPLEEQPAAALVGFATQPLHGAPLEAAAAAALQSLLSRPDFSSIDDARAARPVKARDADVSLAIPQDVNPDLLETLLQELPQQSEDFSLAIQRILSHGSPEDVRVAQRIAHTLKGASNTVGIRGLAELTHHVEDVLLALAKHAAAPPPLLGECLIGAADCLETMVEAVTGTGPAPHDAREVLQQVLDWANRLDTEGAAALGPELTVGPEPTAGVPLPAAHSPAIPSLNPVEPAAMPAIAPADGEPAQDTERPEATVLRVAAPKIDELLRLVGESVIHAGRVQNGVRTARTRARGIEEQLDRIGTLGTSLERLVDLRDFGPAQTQSDSPFDALELDQYSELHSCGRRLIEAAHDVHAHCKELLKDLGELDEVLVAQDRLNRESQDCVLGLRLVPVKTVFPRLQRAARQACRLTGKVVQVELRGGDTAIDSDILSQLVDSLMHLLRNAIDHGIEDAEQRRQSGKEVPGRVQLEFRRLGSSIQVRCTDDGRGLDYAAIRRRAEQLGMLAAGSTPATGQLHACLLSPNFSTREQATQISGRGVGLDIVSSTVGALGGSLQISSKPRRGTTFELLLPVTLLSTHAVLVRLGSQVLAIAIHGIEQLIHLEDGALTHVGETLMFRQGKHFYPAHTLEALIGLGDESGRPADPAGHRTVMIVRCDVGHVAVLVENVLASRDVVIKALGPYVRDLPGICGATILGDGTVTPIIDLTDLVRTPLDAAWSATASVKAPGSAASPRQPTALVVDDSLSARRALAQLLKDSGFQVRTAQDGIDAMDDMKKAAPDILYVDLEMPRMNGIELTSHVRSTAEGSRLPIIMVTSRSTPKHREEADRAGVDAYFTKPFSEDALLTQSHALLTERA